MTWSRPHGWKVAEPGCIPGTVWPQSTHFNYNAISVLWPGMSATPASSLNEPLFVPHASALWASCTSWTLTLCFMPVCSGTWIPLLECHLPFVYLLECLIFQDSAQHHLPPEASLMAASSPSTTGDVPFLWPHISLHSMDFVCWLTCFTHYTGGP